MVDWKGLFEWSMQYQDGTKPSEFKQMSEEDRKWLTEALQHYTFNDSEEIKKHSNNLGNHVKMTEEALE